ncbi:zinc finger protein 62 homolog [Achroia grisella]|uniref:zinc finger protein 62 homolog n=1 Tax=Achroia grisella TaxID=688607 RepID=UPI0027D1FD76|nr:zinc finger protein 62 homolog [Achroia grisella]
MSQILKYSNATPIRCHDGIHYGCCYCSDLFVSSTDLKRHTIDVHSDLANTRFIKRKSMMDFYLKLDVTNLECVICNTALNTYEELMEHLHSKHEKKLHFDIKNQILPFKFDSEAIRCCICLITFTKFRALLEHMNSHYRNFVCAICDKGYVNERRLSYHNQIHESGDFSCDFCPKKFNTLQKKKSHEGYHVKPSGRNKCGYCSSTFVCYRQKLKHITEVHGVHHVKLKCLACDRTFYNSRSLNAHTKRYHLMERSRQCTECSKKFFNTSDLTYHMVKHTGIKRFQCDVCLKSYGRKNTLVEHMRIHNNDRKYKCEYCTQTFVQKCNLKGHMRSKHIEFI